MMESPTTSGARTLPRGTVYIREARWSPPPRRKT